MSNTSFNVRNLHEIFYHDQQPILRYYSYLSTLQQQIAPRGVGASPIYSRGIGAFRHVDSVYLKECMQPEELRTLKGLYTPLVSVLNSIFFGRITQCGFIIDSSQEDEFARMVVRLHVITGLKLWLIDASKIPKSGKTSVLRSSQVPFPIVDLRTYPIKSIRKLLRWKKQYSPSFDGLILYDRLEQIIEGLPKTQANAVQRASSSPFLQNPQIDYRITDTLKWTVLFTKQQSNCFTESQRAQFATSQDDYRKWALFCADLGVNMCYTLRIQGKIDSILRLKIEETGYTVKYYPQKKHTYLVPPTNAGNRKFSIIEDNLDRKLMLKLLQVLYKDY